MAHVHKQYLVDSKSSAFVVKVSAGTIFLLLQHPNCLATSDRATLHFHLSLAVSGTIGDKFELKMSEVIALNPSFSMFSSKISV